MTAPTWITDRAPTLSDADADGEVEVLLESEDEDIDSDTDFYPWDCVRVGTKWTHTSEWFPDAHTYGPSRVVRTFRAFRSITRSWDPNGVECFDAIADDGTAWFRYEHDDWLPQRPLPQPDPVEAA